MRHHSGGLGGWAVGIVGYHVLFGHGGRRGFSPLGFFVLLALMVGFLGSTTTGLILGTIVGLIIAGFIARAMSHGGRRVVLPAGRVSTPADAPAPAAPACLCGATDHTTIEHPDAPRGRDLDARFNSGLAMAVAQGKMRVVRRGGE